MSIHRHTWIGCDAVGCEAESDPVVATANAIRQEAKRRGWSCAHSYGLDFCPEHASEFGTQNAEYWKKLQVVVNEGTRK